MKKTIPIFLAFVCMGFGDSVASFVNIAKGHFSLTNFEANFVAFTGFLMFGLLSIPMGIVQDRIGRKKTLLIGLIVSLLSIILFATGALGNYTVFLAALLLLGGGATILQVSGNPIMRDVSDEGKYSGNLSMAQFIKAIGSFTAPLVFFAAHLLGYTEAQSWNVLFPVFMIAIVVSLISVASIKIDEKKSENKSASIYSTFSILGNPYVFMMVLGIFLYVGAEVCMSSGMPVYFSDTFKVERTAATQYVMYFFIVIMLSRFLGSIILKFISPRTFLISTTVLSMLGFAILATGSQTAALIALVIIAFGFGNIFPLIFSMAIDKMPEYSNELSGLMVTAILGGAVIPLVMGAVADSTSILCGFSVPAICTLYILSISFLRHKRQ